MQSEISIIPSHKIDAEKWNRCISASPNGLIYATTDYLNYIADNWTGIVLNDYSAIMPVAWRKKYGIKYSYDVPFMQQLGIFSQEMVVPLDKMIQRLFSICRYGDYNFNYGNQVVDAPCITNYILSLTNYQDLAKRFSIDAKQYLRKSENYDFKYTNGSVDEAIDICRKLYGERIKNVAEMQYGNFKAICKVFQKQDKVVIRKIINKEQEILAIVLLLKDNKRIYNIMNGTLPKGRVQRANYFLLSGIWKEFQQKDLVFDFEGSDIPGVKAFYKKFGAVYQPYSRIHFNRLPRAVKMLKQ